METQELNRKKKKRWTIYFSVLGVHVRSCSRSFKSSSSAIIIIMRESAPGQKVEISPGCILYLRSFVCFSFYFSFCFFFCTFSSFRCFADFQYSRCVKITPGLPSKPYNSIPNSGQIQTKIIFFK